MITSLGGVFVAWRALPSSRRRAARRCTLIACGRELRELAILDLQLCAPAHLEAEQVFELGYLPAELATCRDAHEFPLP